MDYPILLRSGPFHAFPTPALAVRDGDMLAIQNGTGWSLYRVHLWGGYVLAEYAGETHERDERWIECVPSEIPF